MLFEEGIPFLYYFGDLGKEVKDAAIQDFQDNPDIKIMVSDSPPHSTPLTTNAHATKHRLVMCVRVRVALPAVHAIPYRTAPAGGIGSIAGRNGHRMHRVRCCSTQRFSHSTTSALSTKIGATRNTAAGCPVAVAAILHCMYIRLHVLISARVLLGVGVRAF